MQLNAGPSNDGPAAARSTAAVPGAGGSTLSPLRSRLHATACLLLAAGMPAAARAESAPNWQFDGSALFYRESGRVNVVEPIGRITRLFADGSTASAQLSLDSITGATPNGNLPSGKGQTTTTPSGNVSTVSGGNIPVSSFKDFRGALDLDWSRPLAGFITFDTGAHGSREKDYSSTGISEKVALDLLHHRTNLSAGFGYNDDRVFPRGGTPLGTVDPLKVTTPLTTNPDPKRVRSGMLGLSEIVTRRWMLAVNVTRTVEKGYLTEPYKVISVLSPDNIEDPNSGLPISAVTDCRPNSRDRRDVLTNSVYHLTDDILYLTHRYYWDDWGVKSHAVEVKYRHDLDEGGFLQPHVRLYTQTAARFYTLAFIGQAPPPGTYATSDYRLGGLHSLTLGLTYGFGLGDYPGDFTLRGDYIRQWGNGYPANMTQAESQYDLFPPLNILSLTLTYSVQF